MTRYSIQDLRVYGSAGLLTVERLRQQRPVEEGGEGFTDTRDDGYTDGQLGDAAAAYATTLHEAARIAWPASWGKGPHLVEPAAAEEPEHRITELAKAGALIIAELDRLARLHGAAGEG